MPTTTSSSVADIKQEFLAIRVDSFGVPGLMNLLASVANR